MNTTESDKVDTSVTEKPPSNSKVPQIINDTIALAIGSALAYFCAYKYQLSYLSHFNITSEFVEISLANILGASAYVIGVSLVVLFLFNTLWPAITNRRFAGIVLLLLIPVVFILWGALTWVQNGWSWFGVGVPLLIGLAGLYVNLGHQILVKKKHHETIWQSIDKCIDTEVSFQDRLFFSWARRKVGDWHFNLLIVGVIFLPMVFGLVGSLIAKNRTQFLIFENSHSWLLVENYSDRFIMVEYDSAVNSLRSGIWIASFEELSKGRLVARMLTSTPTNQTENQK